jgi:type IV secretory pathway TrbL component
MKRLYWSAALVVLAHAVVVYWHLVLLARFGAAITPDQVPLFTILANLIPLIAVILMWAHFPRVGTSLLLFLAVPLAIGGYSHFLSPGSDNVFRMAPSELTVAFRVSAVLLLILESLGCWLSIQILRTSSMSAASAAACQYGRVDSFRIRRPGAESIS